MAEYYKIKAKEGKTLPANVILPPYKSEDNGLVISIDENGFAGRTEIKSFTISENVKYVGASAFNGCTGLTEMTIPVGVVSMGGNAFSGCTGLDKIKVLGAMTNWPESWNGGIDIDQQAYAIKTNIQGLGTVIVSEESVAGKPVYVNVAPADGYKLKSASCSVEDFNGSDGSYTFTMPAQSVVISVIFEKATIDDEDYAVISQSGSARKIINILSDDTNITDDGLITNGYQIKLVNIVEPEEMPISIPVIYTTQPVTKVQLYDTMNNKWVEQSNWSCGTTTSSVEIEIDNVQTTLNDVYTTTYVGSSGMGAVVIRCLIG